MSRLLVIAVGAPLLMIGAAYPEAPDGAGPAAAVAPAPGPVTYRPCRPGRGDDRCIQLYERGVRAAYARWLREHGHSESLAEAAPVRTAAARPRRAQQRHRLARSTCPPAAAAPAPAARARTPAPTPAAAAAETRGM